MLGALIPALTPVSHAPGVFHLRQVNRSPRSCAAPCVRCAPAPVPLRSCSLSQIWPWTLDNSLPFSWVSGLTRLYPALCLLSPFALCALRPAVRSVQALRCLAPSSLMNLTSAPSTENGLPSSESLTQPARLYWLGGVHVSPFRSYERTSKEHENVQTNEMEKLCGGSLGGPIALFPDGNGIQGTGTNGKKRAKSARVGCCLNGTASKPYRSKYIWVFPRYENGQSGSGGGWSGNWGGPRPYAERSEN